jgi:hypothetical protein
MGFPRRILHRAAQYDYIKYIPEFSKKLALKITKETGAMLQNTKSSREKVRNLQANEWNGALVE